MDTPTLIALLHGPDQPGLVARVASWIFERGGNILHADQHRDREAGIFFQRVEWQAAFREPATGKPASSAAIRALADKSQGRPADRTAAEKEFAEFARS